MLIPRLSSWFASRVSDRDAFPLCAFTFRRFTGGHPGCGLGLQCSHGPLQDPVPNPGLVGLLDNRSRCVHSWNLAPFTDTNSELYRLPSGHSANTRCLFAIYRCVTPQGFKGQACGTRGAFNPQPDSWESRRENRRTSRRPPAPLRSNVMGNSTFIAASHSRLRLTLGPGQPNSSR